MKNGEIFLGAVPPVQLNLENCGSVKVDVKIVCETRAHDTLKKWAEAIEIMVSSGQVEHNRE